MEINVSVDEGFEGCLEVSWLESVVEKTLLARGVAGRPEVSLVITGQEKVRQLNAQYLEKDEPTDVLAFAMLPAPSEESPVPFVVPPDGIQHLGEVIISYPQADAQAREHRHSVKRETAILIIHGVLHLLGFDHDTPEREQEMRARETEILASIGEEAS